MLVAIFIIVAFLIVYAVTLKKIRSKDDQQKEWTKIRGHSEGSWREKKADRSFWKYDCGERYIEGKAENNSDDTDRWNIHESIPEIARKKNHNMSMNKYEVKAVYIPTNRSRKRIVFGVNEADVKSQLQDYKDPDSILEIPYDPPTERQISFAAELNICIPVICCKEDLTALISEALRKDYMIFKGKPWKRVPPDDELLRFVDMKHIPYSRYSEEFTVIRNCYMLYLKEEKEKIAFMIACMNKHIKGNWNFQNWNQWLSDAEELLADDSFKRSLINNAGRLEDGFQGFDYHETINSRSKLYQMIAEKAEIT